MTCSKDITSFQRTIKDMMEVKMGWLMPLHWRRVWEKANSEAQMNQHTEERQPNTYTCTFKTLNNITGHGTQETKQ